MDFRAYVTHGLRGMLVLLWEWKDTQEKTLTEELRTISQRQLLIC